MSDEQPIIDGDEPEGYDACFRREVEAGQREAHAPGAVWRSAEEVNATMARLRSEREQQALEKAS